MSLITPKELSLGVARGQFVRGRVRMYTDTPSKQGYDCVDVHLIVEPGLSGVLFIEGWRDQARKLKDICQNGKMITIECLTIKTMSDKAQWQCSNLEFDGVVSPLTKLTKIPNMESCTTK